MTSEHKGTTFAHSCVKVPLDPYSRQPTPMYERPARIASSTACSSRMSSSTTTVAKTACSSKARGLEDRSGKAHVRIDSRSDNRSATDLDYCRVECNNILEFIESIPAYEEVQYLSNEQFKQRLDYLKRKQRLLLKNLRNCLEEDENTEPVALSDAAKSKSEVKSNATGVSTSGISDELTLKGKRCNLEESRTYSPPPPPLPPVCPEGSFSCLVEDQDFLTYRCKNQEKADKTRMNEDILSASKCCWSSSSESKTPESDDLEEIKFETKSLPSRSPKRWHTTLPKPFSFTLRNLQKRIRSMDLLKTSSLPPSMARRDRVKSAVSTRSQKSSSEERARSGCSRDSVALSRGTPLISEHSRSSAMTSTLPPHGNNLAAILRAQAARERMERDIQKRLEEKRYEQMIRLRKSMIGRKPAWRALRSAARHEHERDLDFRATLRRDEAREQAERHRLHMELMLDRVTQIPTLFERYSQTHWCSWHCKNWCAHRHRYPCNLHRHQCHRHCC